MIPDFQKVPTWKAPGIIWFPWSLFVFMSKDHGVRNQDYDPGGGSYAL
jgi:hypothetical protein